METGKIVEAYTKIAENNVEVFKEVPIKDTDGVDRTVLEYSKSYGQDVIDNELDYATKELELAENLDAAAYKVDLIAEKQAAVDRLNSALSLLVSTVELTDTTGNVFNIYDEGSMREFNLSPELIETVSNELSEAESLNSTLYKRELVDSAKDKIDRLGLIQAEMNKP